MLLHAAVSKGHHEDCRKGDQGRFREQLAGNPNAIAFRHEIRRQPQEQAEIDQAVNDAGEAEREELAEEGTSGESDRRPFGEGDCFGVR